MSVYRRIRPVRVAGRWPRFKPFAMAMVGAAFILPAITIPGTTVADENAAALEEPMQPIAKVGATAPICRSCARTEVRDGNGQRVAERAAPEYSAPRRAPSMMTPSNDDGLSEDTLPDTSDAVESGGLVSLPGSPIGLPALLP